MYCISKNNTTHFWIFIFVCGQMKKINNVKNNNKRQKCVKIQNNKKENVEYIKWWEGKRQEETGFEGAK